MKVQLTNVFILCEDLQTYTFIRRFLVRQGVNDRRFAPIDFKARKGSGEQYVREQLPNELKVYRRKCHHQMNALIVAIDADTGEVARRVRELENECKQKGIDPRQSDDRVMYVIPKRNIETWLAYLSGSEVNENDEYKRLDFERDCQGCVDRLSAMCKSKKLREPAPPSLQTACTEYERFRCLMDQG
jgi:hypothetical protein